MRHIALFPFTLLLTSPVLAQTIPAASQTDAVQEEADRIRQFQRTLSADLTPVAPDGIKEVPLYAPNPDSKPKQTHTVVKGDTLYGLSKRYGVSVSDLRSANALQGNHLDLGQPLTIPAIRQSASISNIRKIVEPVPVEDETRSVSEPLRPNIEIYAVLPKDNLSAISRRSCVPVAKLIEINTLERPDRLIPGQRLRLPANHCLPN